MARGYLPAREAQLVTWIGDFYRNLSTKPANYFGVSEQAIQEYNVSMTRFTDAYMLASNPDTRTGPTIEAKQMARKTLINSTRSLVDVMQAWPQMTDDKRRLLGITVRATRSTSTGRPGIKPYIEVAGVDQNTITLRILQNKSVRAKPKGVIGAILFSAVAPTAPTTESGWFCQGNSTKSTVLVQFPDTVPPGSRVWFTAAYFNRKLETGPAANVVSTNLPGGAAFTKAA